MLQVSKCDAHLISATNEKPIDWLPSLPAVFPSCSDILNFVIPHIRHRENEKVSVGVHAPAQLQGRIKATIFDWESLLLTLHNRPPNPYLRDQFLLDLQSFLDCFR